MIEYFLIILATFFLSLLTFYSNFGFGTILMPILAIFVPLEVAIIITAIIHVFNNLFKSLLLWKSIDWKITLKFGLVALVTTSLGAFLLGKLSEFNPIMKYSFFSLNAEISISHICIGVLLILVSILNLFNNKELFQNLYVSGAISGFFGGLSGHQGAFRSAFLIRQKLTKEAFIATNSIIAVVVDIIRLIIYSMTFQNLVKDINYTFIILITVASLAGILIGMYFLKQVTIKFIQNIITILLFTFGILLIIGLI